MMASEFNSALHCILCLGNADSAARRLIWAEQRSTKIQWRSKISRARYAMNVDMSRSASKLRKSSISFSNALSKENSSPAWSSCRGQSWIYFGHFNSAKLSPKSLQIAASVSLSSFISISAALNNASCASAAPKP
jgi:hypothetical protein